MTNRTLYQYLPKRVTRFGRDESGATSTIEFVLLFPLFMVMFLSMFEVGLLMTRAVMLDRGLNIAIREVRLSAGGTVTSDSLRDRICEEAWIFKTCSDDMVVEMTVLTGDDFSNMPSAKMPCVDRANNVTPTTDFTMGTSNNLVFLRACIVVNPWFPFSGFAANLSLDPSGGFAIRTEDAFAIEPGAST